METLHIDVRGQRGSFGYHWEVNLPAVGVTGIFGPSGAGKTSLLRAIAGLDSAAEGRISLGGDDWLDSRSGLRLPPHKRPVGYVFQDTRLLVHLSVRGNLQYAASRSGADAAYFASVERDLDLTPLLDREVQTLSGGERQRVAIGRALLTRPRLLLMDEPLSANDVERRGNLLTYIRRVARDFGIPTLYVTHSLDELAALTERTVVCREGGVVMVGETDALLTAGALQSGFTSPEVGSVLSGRVVQLDERLGIAALDVGGHRFTVPIGALRPDDDVRLQIHARDIALAVDEPSGLSIRNALPVEILAVADPGEGAWADVRLKLAEGQVLVARITRASVESLGLVSGMSCYALIKSASMEHHPALGVS